MIVKGHEGYVISVSSGEHCKLDPRRGLEAEPQRKSIWVHFSLKILHLMATILMIFLRIKCSNFIFLFLKIHNFTFEDAQINFNDTQCV